MSTNKKGPIGYSNTCVQQQREAIPWLWEGVLVQGAVTLLSAPEKVGKTTLLSLLLDRRRVGGELLGRTVYPGKTVLCSEENDRLWALRQPPLDFGPDLLFHRPPGPFPMRGRWNRFINDLCELSFPEPSFDLLVIDTATSFMPLADRNKRTQRWALSTLKLVTGSAAVLILNQSRNVHRPLAAFADIVIEMTIPRSHSLLSPSGRGSASSLPSPSGKGAGSFLPSPSGRGVGGEGCRRRIFTGVGRYPETLQTATAELNPEGTDYVLLPDSPAPPPPLLNTLQTLLTASPTPLTCRELLDRWPAPAPRPDSLWRTLRRGVELCLFTPTGKGTKTEPFRFTVVRQTNVADSYLRPEAAETN
jgi:hypothetical protein